MAFCRFHICLLVGESRLHLKGSATLPREPVLVLELSEGGSPRRLPLTLCDCPQGQWAGWGLTLQEPHFCRGPASHS